MGTHLGKELGRHSHNVSTSLQGFINVDHLSDAANDDLGRGASFFKTLVDLPDDRCSIVANVPNTPPEQTDIIRACLSRDHGLVVRHTARTVHPTTHPANRVNHAQLVPADGYLDVQLFVIAKLSQEPFRLNEHLLWVRSEQFDTERNLRIVLTQQ